MICWFILLSFSNCFSLHFASTFQKNNNIFLSFSIRFIIEIEKAWTLDRFDKYEAILWSSRNWCTRMSIYKIEVSWPWRDAITWTNRFIHWNCGCIHTGASAGIRWRSLHAWFQSYGFPHCILYGGADGLCSWRSSRCVCTCTPTGHLQTRLHQWIIEVNFEEEWKNGIPLNWTSHTISHVQFSMHIVALCSRYGVDEEDTFPAPRLPEWCLGELYDFSLLFFSDAWIEYSMCVTIDYLSDKLVSLFSTKFKTKTT